MALAVHLHSAIYSSGVLKCELQAFKMNKSHLQIYFFTYFLLQKHQLQTDLWLKILQLLRHSVGDAVLVSPVTTGHLFCAQIIKLLNQGRHPTNLSTISWAESLKIWFSCPALDTTAVEECCRVQSISLSLKCVRVISYQPK